MEMIEFINICKEYNGKKIYKDFNLTVSDNEITAILGESGSGKTTLFNIALGLTEYNGKVSGVKNPSVVFQRDSLVKNLTVEQNLRLVNPQCNVEESLELVGLKEYKNSYIKELSAGMARRIVILRALIYPFDTLFMDEPFINLDISKKCRLMDRIKEYKKKNKTVVFITHDVFEACYLADRVVVLHDGEIIFDKPVEKEKTEKELFGLMKNVDKS